MILNYRLALYVLAFFTIIGAAHANSKYPNDLMTDGFDIVTDDDLAYDFENSLVWRFNPKSDNSIHWQCVPVKNTKATFSSWIFEKKRLCAPEVRIRDQAGLQLFVIQHAQSMSYCRQFKRKWSRLVKGQKIVCLNADLGLDEINKKDGRYRLWGLEKYKTKLGCDSYFYGVCNTSGCSKNQCKDSIKN